MASDQYFTQFCEQTEKRAVEATLSILGISNPALREHLLSELSKSSDGKSFIADPVFEATFPWEAGQESMKDFAGDLFQESLITAMDTGGFSREIRPFKHQVKAWKSLINEKKSIIVTSGTGSGKTECFMVPILNDLVHEYEANGDSQLVGVRALFIYPLNALINSQRERLRAWTDYYGDGVRFCLFNGNTKEYRHPDQGNIANEILTRAALRATPAPMLVTNITMLEYMLVRQKDAPIIERSKGKLRWIVLDEAHSYLGSQAAELSLLLRRVLHAFGVESKHVRFVATSATIGGEEAEASLQRYLADLAGIPVEHVSVIGGRRSMPAIAVGSGLHRSLDDLAQIDPENPYSKAKYNALVNTKRSLDLRNLLAKAQRPMQLSEIRNQAFNGEAASTEDLLQWLDLCSASSLPGQDEGNPEKGATPFLPLRGHFLHQVLSGLWCCVNKHCQEKTNSQLGNDWPFGFVHTERRLQCQCGAPVFELAFCDECNKPYLMALQKEDRLVQHDLTTGDTFSLDDQGDDANDYHQLFGDSKPFIIAGTEVVDETYPVSLDRDAHLSGVGAETYDLNALAGADGGKCCPSCGSGTRARSFIRRLLPGAPFYIGNAMPTLLDLCREGESPESLPHRGQKLITFTDNRQGTAGISIKLQRNAERESVRSLVYSECASSVHLLTDAERQGFSSQIEALEQAVAQQNGVVSPLSNMLEEQRAKLQADGTIKPVHWRQLVNGLSTQKDVSPWMFDYYKGKGCSSLAGWAPSILAEMLLLREVARRPKRQNSLETLGLVALYYPALEAINSMPDQWQQSLKLSLEEWRAFLKIFLDFYVRENTILEVPNEWIRWIGGKIFPKAVVGPDSNADVSTTNRLLAWPRARTGNGLQNRMARLLAAAGNLSFQNASDVDLINTLLKAAWAALTRTYSTTEEGHQQQRQLLKPAAGELEYRLNREEISFKACERAWICPVTHRLLDTTFAGLTPYLPQKELDIERFQCSEVKIPICKVDVSNCGSELQRKQKIRQWIADHSEIAELRRINLWTDVSDKILEGSRFFRVAEHSAQQWSEKLDRYEGLFKEGKLNVLSCSTTMEMGVDIGGISVVAMNNVPPHPANYLQRAGRAGRRGETRSLAFAVCKDNPHERAVFRNPLWPFTTTIPAPYISLNSEQIVQRHVNSLLLAKYLKDVVGVESEATGLNCAWFFYAENQAESNVSRMLEWLNGLQIHGDDQVDQAIKKVIAGSALAPYPLRELLNRSIAALERVREEWLPAYQKLKSRLEGLEGIGANDPFRKKLEYDIKCMGEKGFLLNELSARAYLPGHGFPSGVVTFDYYTIENFKRGDFQTESGRIDNRARMRARPNRDLPTALREYAPGANVILDGLNYKSRGILINQFAPNEDYTVPQLMLLAWRCHKCGTIGNEPASSFEENCTTCGTRIKQENRREFVVPDGFAVDFYSTPTTDTNTRGYIPFQDPWVTARSAVLTLFEPRLGGYSSSTQGQVFHHSAGEHGTGYAVCLRCGRADSMAPDGKYPAGLVPGKEHKPLQGRIINGQKEPCQGSYEEYAIKGSVYLGAIEQTDIFELYLKHPGENSYLEHSPKAQLPWTLAIVLRQSLADILGISIGELGVLVKPTSLSDGQGSLAAIVLYDQCSGGAGFASAAHRYLPEMLNRARSYLRCPEDCDTACQACLLGYETRFQSDLLNRRVALDYLESVMPYLEVPEEARLFGEATEFCFAPLGGELSTASQRGATKVTLFTQGAFEEWNFATCDIKESCLALRNLFADVELVLPSANIRGLAEEHKEDLLSLARFGVDIRVLAEDANIQSSSSVITQVSGGAEVTSFATSTPGVKVPDASWWEMSEGYLVKTSSLECLMTDKLDLESLRPPQKVGDVELDLLYECDGSLSPPDGKSGFGNKLWAFILPNSPTLANKLNGEKPIVKATYSDSWVLNPISLLLIGEVIDSLRKDFPDLWGDARFDLTLSDKTPTPEWRKSGLAADWYDNETKRAVCLEYFQGMGLRSKVTVMNKRIMPHGRSLELTWSDGSFVRIRFDQGMGCWRLDGQPTRFVVTDPADRQVPLLYDELSRIKVRNRNSSPTQVFVKVREA